MKKAFTLSEVLISVAIIGVIAMIAIPIVHNNIKKEQYRSSLRKSVSVINQAIVRHQLNTGLNAHDYETAEELIEEVFSTEMALMKGESHFTSDVCDENVFTTIDGTIYCISNYHSEMSDSRGSACDFYNEYPCIENDGPNLWIDVNGKKKPNKATRLASKPEDIYQAQIYANKVEPYGFPTTSLYLGKDFKSERYENPQFADNNENSNQTQNPNIVGDDENYYPEDNDNQIELPENQGGFVPENDMEQPDISDEGMVENPDEENIPEQEDDEDKPDIPNFDMNDDRPDEDNPYYGEYDPNRWPSWLDFLRWLLGKIYGILFG